MKDHCVIGEADIYQVFRILVAVVLIIVPFGIAPGIPYLTDIHKWLTETDSDTRYYIWAMYICATLFDIVVVGIDIHTILSGFHDNTTFSDVTFYYFIALIFILALPLLDFVIAFTIIWSKHKAHGEGSGEENGHEGSGEENGREGSGEENGHEGSGQENDVEKRLCTTVKHKAHSEGSGEENGREGSGEEKDLEKRLYTTVKQWTFLIIIVFAVQMLFEHSYYFLLAIIASPVHSISILTLCVTGTICAVMLSTGIVRLHNKKIVGVFSCIYLCALPVIVIIFVIGVIMMLMFLVSEHQDGGIVVLVPEVLSAMAILILCFYGKKVLRFLGSVLLS